LAQNKLAERIGSVTPGVQMAIFQTSRRLLGACGLWVALTVAAQMTSAATSRREVIPKIHHVFLIILENEGYHVTFGAKSPARYLNRLKNRSALVRNYFATSHLSLGNYITMISGQAPNAATDSDCEQFADFVGSGTTADGQAIGTGCVYPAKIQTIANQLEAKGLTWKAYMEDMGNNPQRESSTCGHPAIGALDNTQVAEVGDQYAARHDPFVYFHAIIDSPTCAQHVVNMSALTKDLTAVDTTSNYVFITPNLCHDGHDGGGGTKCVDGEPGGLVSADQFLKNIVPQILASPAYRRDGLLIITFDESDLEYNYDATKATDVTRGDAAACCNELPGPNIAAYQADSGIPRTAINGPGLIGPGGGRIGAVMLSPFIKPGTVSTVSYIH
jgi:phosphatidylinositol-3-phosphatase